MIKVPRLLALVLAFMIALPLTAYAKDSSLATQSLKRESTITAEELEAGLLHEMKVYAEDYIEAYEDTGIDPVFLAAKDAFESGWGRFPTQGNNLSGFKTSERFDSVSESIAYVSDFMDREYLTEDGRFYKGDTISDVNHYYNGNLTWELSILRIMEGIHKRIDAYRAQNTASEPATPPLEEPLVDIGISVLPESDESVTLRQIDGISLSSN